MNVQFLDGIDIQMLDGVKGKIDATLEGFDSAVQQGLTDVSSGIDLAGFVGDASVQDDEKVRAYLVRTYETAKRYPQSVAAYQDPKTFLGMLGHVLANWDTEDREEAIEAMAEEEERLIGLGRINVDFAKDDDEYEYTEDVAGDDDYEDEGSIQGLDGKKKSVSKKKKHKKGFFNALKKVGKAMLVPTARNIVDADPFTSKLKDKVRRKVAKKRRKKTLKGIDQDGRVRTVTQYVAPADESLQGIGDSLLDLMNGTDLKDFGTTGNAAEDSRLMRRYLTKQQQTMNAVPEEFFDDEEERLEVLGQIDYVLANWDNEKTRERVLGQLSGDDRYDDLVIDLGAVRKRNETKGFFKKVRSLRDKKKKGKRHTKKDIADLNRANTFVSHRKLKMNEALRDRMLERKMEQTPAEGIDGVDDITEADIANFNYDALFNGVYGVDDVTQADIDNFNYDALLNGVDFASDTDGDTAARNYLLRTRKEITARPALYFADADEYEDAVGMLDYAINNLGNDEAMDMLCGIGLDDAQYEDLQITLGALAGKKSKKAKKQAKKQKKQVAKAKKKEQKQQKKEQKKQKKEEKRKKKDEKREKKQKARVEKLKKKGKTKKAKRVEKRQKFFNKLRKGLRKFGQKLKKIIKKVVKFLVKWNPLSIIIRGGLLLCVRLNLFNMALRCYPGSLTREEAEQRLGKLTDDEWLVMQRGYEKLRKPFTRLGGSEKRLRNTLKKGFEKKWKGGDNYNRAELKEATERNKDELNELYKVEEEELKKNNGQGNMEVVETKDPNVAMEVHKTQVDQVTEVTVKTDENGNELTPEQVQQIEAENAQIEAENAELDAEEAAEAAEAAVEGFFGQYALGEVATAASVTSAGTVIGSICGGLSALGISGASLKDKLKNLFQKGKEKIKDVVKNKGKDIAKNVATKAVTAIANRAGGGGGSDEEYYDEPQAYAQNGQTYAANAPQRGGSAGGGATAGNPNMKYVLIGGGILLLGGAALMMTRKRD